MKKEHKKSSDANMLIKDIQHVNFQISSNSDYVVVIYYWLMHCYDFYKGLVQVVMLFF